MADQPPFATCLRVVTAGAGLKRDAEALGALTVMFEELEGLTHKELAKDAVPLAQERERETAL
eukprot:5683523-Amphidinium_carterae.1